MNKNIWTISNIISFLRIFATIPVCYLLWYDMNLEAFIAALIGGALTDNLDGYLARKYNQITEFGKIIDPLADKIFIGGIVIIMAIKSMIPIWVLAIILGRDLLILIGGLLVSKRIKFVPPSNVLGKLTVTVLSINMVFFWFKLDIIGNIILIFSISLIFISFFNYAFHTIKLLKNQKNEAN